MTSFTNSTQRGVGDRAELFRLQASGPIYAGAGNDVIQNETWISLTSPLTLVGGQGSDIIDLNVQSGGAPDFSLSVTGGAIIFGDLAPDLDVAGEGSGDDHIVASVSGDLIFAGGGSDFVNAQAGNDEVYAGAGDDLVLGGAGSDTIHGNAGNDILFGHNPMSLSRSFLSLQTLYNGADDTVFINTRAANAGILQADDGMADQLYGGDGNDVLIGGGGADLLDGGSGMDTASYEYAPAAVNASLSLGRGTGGEADGDIFVSVENLVGSRFGDKLSGSSTSNVLDGGNGDDTLSGGNGNDVLLGGNGNDTLLGGGNNDNLTGGRGRDILTGGSGADRFILLSLLDSASAGRDVITDFSSGQSDRLDLSAIDARSNVAGNQAFAFRGTSGFTGESGQLRYRLDATTTTVMADVDGDKAVDLIFVLEGRLNLSASDFIL